MSMAGARPVVLELHKNVHYIDECLELLNTEWPRSKSARMRGLQEYHDGFPTRLILLNENKVIGHSKISLIPSEPLACFIESVVIQPSQRGKGFGKLLMIESEKYVKKQGFHTVYLSTTDKVEFYAKLGYDICESVNIYGCSITLGVDLCSNKIIQPTIVPQPTFLPNQCSENVNLTRTHNLLEQLTLHSPPTTPSSAASPIPPPAPPPPPPPPPPLPTLCKVKRPVNHSNKVFLKKCL